MQKSLRSFVFVAVLAATSTSSLQAERTGCNPHPQAVAASTTLQLVASAVLNYLGV